METARKVTWGGVIGLVIVAGIGMTLAGFGDWILRPVTVATWLRWSIIGAFAVVGVTFYVLTRRALADDEEGLALVLYVVSMLFGLLAVAFSVREMFPK